MRAFVLAAIAAVAVAAGVSSGSFRAQPKVKFTTDVDTQPLPAPNTSNGLAMKTFTGTSYGKPYTAHVATIDDPRYFRFEVSPGGLPHLSKPTVTAGFRNCEYATNGGFFDMSNGDAEGNVIVNGTVLASYDKFWTNLGITDSEFVVGYISQADLAGYNFRTLLQGVGWLVRNGMGHVNVSISNGEVSEGFVTEMAPRTAVGFDASGHMMVLVVDGEEDIKAGATLYMMEDIMLRMSVMEAVNLDGGGSSVAEYKGKWVSHPTCNDNSNPCERPVSSITCITSWSM